MRCPDCGKAMQKSNSLFYLTFVCPNCGKEIPYNVRQLGRID
jgi:predicted RNA-binding Zn-ribbon protein involved in translation (DUF1610 family)